MDWKLLGEQFERGQKEAAALRNRLANLEEAERHLREAFRIYGRSLDSGIATAEEEEKGGSPTKEIIAQTKEILEQNQRNEGWKPMKSGQILKELVARGMHVGGGQPSSNLSAMLSRTARRDGSVISHGRGKGWSIPIEIDVTTVL